MRKGESAAAMFVLVASHAVAQANTTELSIAATTNTSSVVETSAAKDWAFSISVYTYLVPDDQSFAQPTITADRDWLHLEARYNYENLETGSVWVGYNCSIGDQLSLDFTPMLGGVFGRTTGIAPGYEFTLSWGHSNSTAKASMCSTRAIRAKAFSISGRR